MFRKNSIRGVFILTVVTMMMMAFAPVSGANDSLIVNGDFESGNVGFDTDYDYVIPGSQDAADGAMKVDGRYTVGDDPQDYHPSWDTFGDHTTGAGKMMIVNSNADPYSPNELVWGQTVDLPAAFNDGVPYPMFANGTWNIGEVRVKNSTEEICVKFEVTDTDAVAKGWLITEVHVAIGDVPGDIPQRKGNPTPGKFEIKEKLKPGVTDTEWYCQPYDGETIVAAHADLLLPNRPRDSADGWGAVSVGAEPFDGNDPATYIKEPIAMYRFTMYGASSYWENPAVLEVNFGDIPVGEARLTTTEGEWVTVEYDFDVGWAETIYIAIRDSVEQPDGDDFVIDDISLKLLP